MQAWLDKLTGKMRVQPAIATAVAPTYLEGAESGLSTDLSGSLRTVAAATGGGSFES